MRRLLDLLCRSIVRGEARVMIYYADYRSLSRLRSKHELLVEKKKAESLQDGILAWAISSLFVSLSGSDIPVSFVASASQS